MSNKVCPKCNRLCPPVKGVIAKSCECGHTFASSAISVSLSDSLKSKSAPSAFDPNKFLTEKQRKIQAGRAAQRGEEVEDIDYEGGEEVDFDADSIKINVDVPQGHTTIKLGSLVEQKKGRRDDMYARDKGEFSKQDLDNLRKSLKRSSRENPTDIGE